MQRALRAAVVAAAAATAAAAGAAAQSSSAAPATSSYLAAAAAAPAATITLDGGAPSQAYDGHGGLSAGASSRLLIDYPEPQRSQILDYLYKPSFGANLHQCKIEIGGDTQSTDGTEPSYKHFREEVPQCGTNRGYEMWLLSEAAKRSPDVKSYLLSWGIPNWVGNASYFSAENIEYQVGYAKCVQQTVGGTHPHYIGIWNERSWGSIDYVVSLRNALDAAGLAATKIIVPDGGDCGGVTAAAAANASFASAVYALGEHYPCRNACPRTAEVGLKFWASEDFSTVADWAGAGCWGRSLNQNWVILNSTATISWSTIWAVYPEDSYYGNGLMCTYGQTRRRPPPPTDPSPHPASIASARHPASIASRAPLTPALAQTPSGPGPATTR